MKILGLSSPRSHPIEQAIAVAVQEANGGLLIMPDPSPS
jgi:hypothetical protein